VEEEVQRDVELFHKGDVQAWRAALAKRWWTPENERARKTVKLRSELLQSKCVLATRVVTEEQVKKRFDRDYGVGGVDYELRQILVSTRRPGSRTPDAEYEEKARAKAERILRELRDAADFEELVTLYSEDPWTKPQGGVIPKYRPNLYRSEEFDAAVRSLTQPGQLSGLVKTMRGFHILQLIRRRVTKYEDVKEELRQILMKAEPEPMERITFVKKLRAAAKITR
jgi:parvulin-like peptidyl-prolyl isomerase